MDVGEEIIVEGGRSTPPLRHAVGPNIRRYQLAVLAPLGLFLLTLLLYLTTLTHVHTFDALSYVTAVERKPWTATFHPHHLAYGPLGVLALAAGRLLGYTGGAALPMQVLNATAGALGVALLFAAVRRLTGRADLGLVAALLLGGAYAYWYYAVEIEVYTVATLFLLICLQLLIDLARRPDRRLMTLIGMAQGGAVLFHQTNLLFCVPLAAALAARALIDRRRGIDWRGWTGYGLALGMAVGLPYLLVGIGVSGFRSWGEFADWMTEYTRTGWWGGPITAQKWAGLGTGLSETLAQPGGALLWLLLIGLVVLGLRHVAVGRQALVAGLVAWLASYGAFFFWWEPDNVEFWIASLPPALVLLALALRGERRWGVRVWVALALGATTIGLNHTAITWRGEASRDLQRVIAAGLGQATTPADLALVPDGLLELYLPYYEGHENLLSLNQALFDSGGSWDRACTAVQARMEEALYAGATVLIADEVLHPAELLLRRHHLSQAQVDVCFAGYRPDLLPLPLPAGAPRFWRLPTGQERAEAAGWTFGHGPQGWRAANVEQHTCAGGWCLVPGSDPSLTSPLLDLEASRYEAIEIRLANGTGARDAQLFYAGTDQRLSEEHSVRWTLAATSDAVTYTIPLRQTPGWSGQITRLRLDPIGVGDGGELRIESVRLVVARG